MWRSRCPTQHDVGPTWIMEVWSIWAICHFMLCPNSVRRVSRSIYDNQQYEYIIFYIYIYYVYIYIFFLYIHFLYIHNFDYVYIYIYYLNIYFVYVYIYIKYLLCIFWYYVYVLYIYIYYTMYIHIVCVYIYNIHIYSMYIYIYIKYLLLYICYHNLFVHRLRSCHRSRCRPCNGAGPSSRWGSTAVASDIIGLR